MVKFEFYYFWGMLGCRAISREHYIFESVSFWDFGGYGYDGRLARRWNKDIVEKTALSLYSVYACNPVNYVEVGGRDTF